MHLPIRWKLMLLLWLITLVPIGLLMWLQYRTVASLGTELARVSREGYLEAARAELEKLVLGYAERIARDRVIVELLLRRQAQEVELRLALPPPAGVRIVHAHELDEPDAAPIALETDARYYALTADGRRHPRPVSFELPAVRIAPDADARAVAADTARLAAMAGFFRDSHARYGRWLHWRFTSLANGVHSSYPAHGGYPRDFEPRRRQWYLQAAAERRLVWTPAAVDATTGAITVAAAMPVYRPDGGFAGVTAVDVPIERLLADYGLPPRWAEEGRVLIVGLTAHGLQILARQRYAEHGRDWRTLVATEPLTRADTSALAAVHADMRGGHSAVRRLADAGGGALWAYARIAEPATYLLAIVPDHAIARAADDVRDRTLAELRRHLLAALPTVAAVFLGAALVAYLSARAITEPLHTLARTARAIAAGNLGARAGIRTGDELEAVGRAFDDMVPKLEERLYLRESLAVARDVQQRLLPQEPPALGGVDVYGITRYCEQTGGDYYDYISADAGDGLALGLAVGDVSGHGAPSALLMATVRALLHAFAAQGFGPGALLGAINRFVCRDFHRGQFMTLWYAVVDGRARTLRWASAGHAPALLYRSGDTAARELGGEDIPLGIDPDWPYAEPPEEPLAAGDVLVLGTDGVWECRNAAGEMFGRARIDDVVRSSSQAPARALCEALLEALDRFRGDAPLRDDVTVVVLRV